jgi:hypothetical protein
MIQVILGASSGLDLFQKFIESLTAKYLKFNFGTLLTNHFSQSFLLIRK